MKWRPRAVMKSKVSSEENQLSISTKRNFKVFWMQVWIISRIISFLVFSLFLLSFLVARSLY